MRRAGGASSVAREAYWYARGGTAQTLRNVIGDTVMRAKVSQRREG